MKKIMANMPYIVNMSMKCTSVIFAILGFVGLFTSFGECFNSEISLFKKIMYSCMILLVLWLIVFLINCICICAKKQYKLFDVGDGHSVYVQYGDLFSPDAVKPLNSKRNIVIPVNRCFDTIIDDDLISKNTLHGICMKNLYEKHIFTPVTLNKLIHDKLDELEIPNEDIEKKSKRSGNLKRYDVGTIVEIPEEEKVTYFFLALTSFDKDLHAHTTDEEYILALIRLLIYNNKRSQRYPLIIPLIGAGAADTKKEERDILEYLVALIKMNKKLINCDVHIVVRSTAKNRIAITNL